MDLVSSRNLAQVCTGPRAAPQPTCTGIYLFSPSEPLFSGLKNLNLGPHKMWVGVPIPSWLLEGRVSFPTLYSGNHMVLETKPWDSAGCVCSGPLSHLYNPQCLGLGLETGGRAPAWQVGSPGLISDTKSHTF